MRRERKMRGSWLAIAAGALAIAAANPPARAQSIFDLFARDPARDAIQSRLGGAGYSARSAIVRRGGFYVLDATDRGGATARLVFDARSGALVERVPWTAENRPVARRSAWREAQREDPRPPADIPVRRPYREEYVDLGPGPGAEIPAEVPHPRVVAFGPASNEFPVVAPPPPPPPVRAIAIPERPHVRTVRTMPPSAHVASYPGAAPAAAPAPSPQPPAQTAVPADAIVVPSSTVTTPASSSDKAAPETPKTVEASEAGPKPAPPAAPAPPAPNASINDIPVAPLD
ncbi:MAG: hypothetical protein ACLPN5_02125 [Roseiarcus sp.]